MSVTRAYLVRRNPDGSEELLPLQGGVTTLGRAHSCTIVMRYPTVSRVHARIELHNYRYYLIDQGSANGTFVNGQRNERRQILNAGDEIRLGSQHVVLRFMDANVPRAAPVETPSVAGQGATEAVTTAVQSAAAPLNRPPALSSETAIVHAMASTGVPRQLDTLFSTRLPLLQTALDSAEMSVQLRALFAPGEQAAPLSVTSAELLTYQPGRRATIRYAVAGDRGAVFILYGRLYGEPLHASRALSRMRMLAEQVFVGYAELAVPEPIGLLSALAMPVCRAVEGLPLGEVLDQPRALRAIELAGIWLATLHRSSAAVDRQLNLEAELVVAQAGAALVGHRFPRAAAAVDTLLSSVLARAASLPQTGNVLLHGDYHYGRVVAGQGIAVVGADELCSGDFHFDLAYFCAGLQLLAYRRGLATAEAMRLRDTFLAGYAGTAGHQPEQRFSVFYGLACLKLARLLASRRGPAPVGEIESQAGEVERLLAQGVEALDAAEI